MVPRPRLFFSASTWYTQVAVGLACAAAGTAVRAALDPLLGDQLPFTIYVAVVVFAAWFGGWTGGTAASIGASIAGDYFFVEPRHTLIPVDLHGASSDLLFVAIALGLVWQVARWRHAEAALRGSLADQERAEQELLRSRARFSWVLKKTGIGMWLNELPLAALNWDEATRRLFFVPPDVEPTIDLYWSRIHPDDREATRLAIEASIRDHGLFEIDHRVVDPATGEVRWLRSAGRAAYAADGTPVHFDGIGYDITDRKRAEGALAESERQLRRQADELAEANRVKDEFLATLSHELRTPLNAILGWAQMLVRGKLDDDTARHAIEAIDRNARSQNILIADVLDVSRIVSGKLHVDVRPTDLADSLSAAIDVVRPAADAKRVTLLDDTAPGCIVLGDAARLQQVFWNLLSNAVKFTPEGGVVTVTTRSHDTLVEVSVHDTGIGIPAAFLPHVFERFRQWDSSTTRQHTGLGLGLAIVHHLVELHGGRVTAESAGEGRGSTFTIALPVRAVATPGPLPTFAPAPRPASPTLALAGVRVLVVDDERDARELLHSVLTIEGAEVQTVISSQRGLELVTAWRPDVLVCDIGMPEEDGYALARKLRTLAPDDGGTTPAVALTAYGRPEDRALALAAGYQHHLAKPVVPETLVSVVAALARRALQQ